MKRAFAPSVGRRATTLFDTVSSRTQQITLRACAEGVDPGLLEFFAQRAVAFVNTAGKWRICPAQRVLPPGATVDAPRGEDAVRTGTCRPIPARRP